MNEAPSFIQRLRAGQKQTVAAYGTSLTEGGQWVKDLAAWLAADFGDLATVVNGGLSGKASNTALARLDERVLAHAPDAVFLEFAVNDAALFEAGEPDHGISPEQSRANLRLLIDRIRAARPQAEILLQTMNPAWDAPNGNRSASRRPHLPEYYEGYRTVAAERGLRLIDHHRNWLALQEGDRAKFERYIPDGVHPEPEGSTAVTFTEIRRALAGS